MEKRDSFSIEVTLQSIVAEFGSKYNVNEKFDPSLVHKIVACIKQSRFQENPVSRS
jgi:hypothetical protein